jgi:hypothetical protein
MMKSVSFSVITWSFFVLSSSQGEIIAVEMETFNDENHN